MISAKGYQPLVTQLYFNGDVHIKDDAYASSPKAKKRILEVQKTKTGIAKVSFDVAMPAILHVEPASLDKLTGVYTNVENKKKTFELFKYENTLWMKNEAFGDKFEYAGKNIFVEANNPQNRFWKLEFEINESGTIKITESYIDDYLKQNVFVYIKDK
jgi:hypothetical protein